MREGKVLVVVVGVRVFVAAWGAGSGWLEMLMWGVEGGESAGVERREI